MTLAIQISVFLAFLVWFIYLIKRLKFFQLEGIRSIYLVFAFLLKVIIGTGLWALYTYHYTDRANADIYKYFDDGLHLFNQLKGKPLLAAKWFFGFENQEITEILKGTMNWSREYNFGVLNDNRTMIRFNFLVNYLSFGFIHLHTLFINFLSFVGLIALYKVVNKQLTLPKSALLFALFLIPSALLWGSGILKEGFLLFSLGIFVYGFFNWLDEFSTKNNLLLFIGTGLMLIIKPYVFLSIIPFAIAAAITKRLSVKPLLAYLGVVLIGFAIIVVVQLLGIFDLFDLLQQKQTAFYNVAMMNEAGSVISAPPIQTPLMAIFAIPEVLTTVLFRPFITEINSILYALAAAENLLLLGLITLMIFFFKHPTRKQLNFAFFALFFTLILGTLIGWTTPILGAVVRYKVPFLPFIFSLIFSCIDFNKINHKFNLSIR
ncbi:hypothetical protein OAB47_02275 [Vicingaceae bacterium]|nr:hypothetical protein [Vicingaceae bacterium]